MNFVPTADIVFPSTAQSGDTQTKRVVVNNVTPQSDIREVAPLSGSYQGESVSGTVGVVQQADTSDPTFTVENTTGFQVEIVATGLMPSSNDQWFVDLLVTKL